MKSPPNEYSSIQGYGSLSEQLQIVNTTRCKRLYLYLYLLYFPVNIKLKVY